MGAVASEITSITIVNSTVYSAADQRERQNPASLAFVRGIHRGPVTNVALNSNIYFQKNISNRKYKEYVYVRC